MYSCCLKASNRCSNPDYNKGASLLASYTDTLPLLSGSFVVSSKYLIMLIAKYDNYHYVILSSGDVSCKKN